MRQEIQPKYKATQYSCACGNSFLINSAHHQAEVKLDICSNCHPLFTGKDKLIDSEGQIEKFNKKYAAMKAHVPKAKPAAKVAEAPKKAAAKEAVDAKPSLSKAKKAPAAE